MTFVWLLVCTSAKQLVLGLKCFCICYLTKWKHERLLMLPVRLLWMHVNLIIWHRITLSKPSCWNRFRTIIDWGLIGKTACCVVDTSASRWNVYFEIYAPPLPLTNSAIMSSAIMSTAVMSTLTVHCWWEDGAARERISYEDSLSD